MSNQLPAIRYSTALRHPQLAPEHTGREPSLESLQKAYHDAGDKWLEADYYGLCDDIIEHFMTNHNFRLHPELIIEGISCFKFAIEHGYEYHYNSAIDPARMYHKIYTYNMFDNVICHLSILTTGNTNAREFLRYYFAHWNCANDELLTECITRRVQTLPFISFPQKKLNFEFLDSIGFKFDYKYYDILFSEFECNPDKTEKYYSELVELGIELGFKMNNDHAAYINYSNNNTMFKKSNVRILYKTFALGVMLEMNGKTTIADRIDEITKQGVILSNYLNIFTDDQLKNYYREGGIDNILAKTYKYMKQHTAYAFRISNSSSLHEARMHIMKTHINTSFHKETEDARESYFKMAKRLAHMNINIKPCTKNEYLFKILSTPVIANYEEWIRYNKYRADIISSCKVKLNFIVKNKRGHIDNITLNNINNLQNLVISYI